LSVDTPATPRPATAPADIPSTRSAGGWGISRTDIILALLLFAIAMTPRAIWAVYTDRPPQELNDPTLYALFGDLIANGDGYIRPTGEKIAYYPVGFPAMIGALHKGGDIFGWDRSILNIKIMNGAYGALTVVLVYLLASRLFDRRVAFGAGALLALFPSQIYYGGTILSEAMFTFFFVAAVVVLLWRPWPPEGLPWPQLLAAGLLLSASTMTRGITLIFPLLLLAVWLFTMTSKKRALAHAAILFAGIAVLTVPWSVRNSIAFGTLVGPSTNLGDDLCIGNFYGAQGQFTLTGKCFEGTEGLSPSEVEIKRNREGVRIAVEDVLRHPFRMPKLIAQKAYWLMYTDDDGLVAVQSYGHDPFIPPYRFDVLSFLANAVYYATGVIVILGAVAFALTKDPRRLIVLLTMLYVLAVPLAFFGDPRFHFPAIPFATIIAAATVIGIWDHYRTRRLPSMEALRA
jgi:4-amino-4-deoxy-L-arabinose transferase-like glycosyltransferase